MMFKDRSYTKELLDGDNIPFRDIVKNMQELNVINSRLGGHKITCAGIDHFVHHTNVSGGLQIAEIGCGGGDNLLAIHEHLQRNDKHYFLTGVDIKDACIQFARQKNPVDINWICSDYTKVQWPADKPDVIFSSLFCHHFNDEELIAQLKWMKENSRLGFFINDLHRHPLAYWSISLLTRLFSKSYLVKNDAPLSVKRGFKRKEWIQLLAAAGISNYTIKWKWAFRYLIYVSNEQR